MDEKSNPTPQDKYASYKSKAVEIRPFTMKEEGSDPSTVRMATETFDGVNWYSFPTIFPKEGNEGSSDPNDWIIYGDDIEGAFKEAQKRGEVFEFGKDKQSALDFGEGSWKPQLFKKGGKVSKKKNPALWKRIVSRIKSGSKGGRPGQWSARKAQLAVAAYKKAGGGYKGKKSSKNKLAKWTKQKWTTSDGKPSKGKKRYLPAKAWKNLTASEKRATNAAKARGNKKGKQFVKQPKAIAKKTARYRK